MKASNQGDCVRDVCSKSGSEKSRYPYPLPSTSAGGQIYLLHAGWAGKYAGQATISYTGAGAIAGANGVMVPLGNFFNAEGNAQMSTFWP